MKYLTRTFLLLSYCSSLAAEPVKFYSRNNSKAPFSVATQVGNTVYLSGMIGMDNNGELSKNFEEQVHQVMKNIKKSAEFSGVTFDSIFKCTVMLDNVEKWPEFNAVYVTYFKPNRLPSRSAFGVDGLAFNAEVEVECMAYKESNKKVEID